jgi:metal-responsive CopG/Arc/MetJ family transcriptional regulator
MAYTELVMIALSIKLPEELAERSRRVARKLGITRSELIRQALIHEIDQVQAGLERRAMAQSLQALAETADEIEALDRAFDETLPEDKEGWWNG